MSPERMDKKWSVELQAAYAAWMERHIGRSKGEAKRRLVEHGHAERMFLRQVWWPAFGSFEGLYPEYEVRDFKDKWRYLDYAYLSQGFKVCIEIDGYGSHWRDADRWRFADHLMRQNQLVIDGWLVLRFSYDDVMEKPRRCQQTVQQLLGRRGLTDKGLHQTLQPTEQAILRAAFGSLGEVKVVQIAATFGIYRKTAAKHLKALAAKGYLLPVKPDGRRICRYKVNPAFADRAKFLY